MKAVVLGLVMALLALSACSSGSGSPDSGSGGSGGSGICQGGCLCGQPTATECAAKGCYVDYARQPDGSSQYVGCLNGPIQDASPQ